jgi:hypothetical protein
VHRFLMIREPVRHLRNLFVRGLGDLAFGALCQVHVFCWTSGCWCTTVSTFCISVQFLECSWHPLVISSFLVRREEFLDWSIRIPNVVLLSFLFCKDHNGF